MEKYETLEEQEDVDMVDVVSQEALSMMRTKYEKGGTGPRSKNRIKPRVGSRAGNCSQIPQEGIAAISPRGVHGESGRRPKARGLEEVSSDGKMQGSSLGGRRRQLAENCGAGLVAPDGSLFAGQPKRPAPQPALFRRKHPRQRLASSTSCHSFLLCFLWICSESCVYCHHSFNIIKRSLA